MNVFTKPEPLSDAELDRLGNFLKNCKGRKAMNVEELDGFFAALIAGPEIVMPSEYSPEVFGGEVSQVCEFSSAEEANEIFGLLIRHWNAIAGALFNHEVYVPLVLEDVNGVAHGNDWARGFMRGMHMRHDGWATLVNDEENGGCLIPVMNALPRARRRLHDASKADCAGEARGYHRAHGRRACGGISVFQASRRS